MHNPWYLFNETAILYHGTSSAFLDIIRTQGLLPPDENLQEYAHRIVKKYLEQIPVEIEEKIKKHTLTGRQDSAFHKTSNVIYLSGDFKQAENYANSYYRHGGEIGYEVWRWVNEYTAHQKGYENAGRDVHVYPIYNNSRPIVLEVEVPRAWMRTYRSLPDSYKRLVKHWKRLRKWYAERGVSFKDYLDKEAGVEIRVEEPISPNAVKKVHNLHT